MPEALPHSSASAPALPPVRRSRITLITLALVALFLVIGVVARYGASMTGLAYAFFVVTAVVLSDIDLRLRILPNRIVLPAIGIGVTLLLLACLIDSPGDVPGRPIRIIAAALVLFVVYLGLALISPRGLGMGDVKLAAFVGIYLGFEGWTSLLLGAAAGFVLAAIVGLAVLLSGRGTRHSTIPFGPLMFIGAMLILAFPQVSDR